MKTFKLGIQSLIVMVLFIGLVACGTNKNVNNNPSATQAVEKDTQKDEVDFSKNEDLGKLTGKWRIISFDLVINDNNLNRAKIEEEFNSERTMLENIFDIEFVVLKTKKEIKHKLIVNFKNKKSATAFEKRDKPTMYYGKNTGVYTVVKISGNKLHMTKAVQIDPKLYTSGKVLINLELERIQ